MRTLKAVLLASMAAIMLTGCAGLCALYHLDDGVPCKSERR